MFVRTEPAMKSATSLGISIFSAAAFLRRIATFISRSGGWMSAIRPHSKRERRRSSSVGISLGRRVGGEDDLLLRVVERVEGVEELLLGRVLSGDELHVVHQQHVELAVALLELVHRSRSAAR